MTLPRIAGAAAAILLAAYPAGAEVLVPTFEEETAASGVQSVYAGDWEFMVGGGAAAFDCSGDDLPDLFLAAGAGPSGLWRNASAPAGPLRFTPVADFPALDNVTGAYPLDIDGDGIIDLAVLRVGENQLLRGLGECRFAPANALWGFDGGDDWTAAFAATWEAGASWPTLAIGNYIDQNATAFPWGSCTENTLHRPGTPGQFAAPQPLRPSHCALSMLFTDWNRSGQRDLRISNDREYYKGGQEQLWRLPPGAPPALYTEAEGWARLRIWGMGIAAADVTGDGRPDYFLTSMADNRLQTLKPGAAGPAFEDVAFARGVTAHRPYFGEVLPSTAWHAQFGDVNADGRLDLFIVKGNVAEMPDFARADPNNLLLQRPDGTFEEAGDRAGVASTATGRGGLVLDLNADGQLDLVVVNRWAPAQIWRNATPRPGASLALRLHQPGPNRDAIGAWIEVRVGNRVEAREVTVGGGHASGFLGWQHFGLGAATIAEVRITWPDGAVGPWMELAAGSRMNLDRPIDLR